MGAYSPAPVVTPEIHDRVMREVMWPTVRALADENTPYVGFLYAGLMIAADGTPKVLEFNCRFGDPETQPILARMRSDITVLCEAGLDGRLAGMDVEDRRAAVGVAAAGGYPETVGTGDVIYGLDAAASFRACSTRHDVARRLSPTAAGRLRRASATVRAAQRQHESWRDLPG
jgi:phosphoribosylamine--glycine ligase